jgi:hypothetical protein
VPAFASVSQYCWPPGGTSGELNFTSIESPLLNEVLDTVIFASLTGAARLFAIPETAPSPATEVGGAAGADGFEAFADDDGSDAALDAVFVGVALVASFEALPAPSSFFLSPQPAAPRTAAQIDMQTIRFTRIPPSRRAMLAHGGRSVVASSSMRRTSLEWCGALLLLSVFGAACGSKKDPAPAASIAAPRPSMLARPKPVKTVEPEDTGDAPDDSAKPVAQGDPILGGLSKAEGPPIALDKKVDFASAELNWAIPVAWVVDDWSLKPGAEKANRKACHPPALTDDTPYFDVLEAAVGAHVPEEWNGQPFPVVGQKPNGGEDKWDWSPWAAVTLGSARFSAVATHRTENPEIAQGESPRGPYVHVWMFFKHPKTEKVIQVMLTWKAGDQASQKILEAVARSIAPTP